MVSNDEITISYINEQIYINCIWFSCDFGDNIINIPIIKYLFICLGANVGSPDNITYEFSTYNETNSLNYEVVLKCGKH